MTIAEQHTLFKIEYDKVDSANKPNVNSVMIDILLNDALRTFVLQRYRGVPPKTEGYEESQKRRDDLAFVTVQREIQLINNYTQVYPNTFDTSLNNYRIPIKSTNTYPGIPNYWIYISNLVKVDYNFCGKTKHSEVPAKMMQQDDYMNTRFFKITRANIEKPYILEMNQHDPSDVDAKNVDTIFELDLGLKDFNEGGTLKNLSVIIRYIRKPMLFGLVLNKYPLYLTTVTDCPAPEYAHQEIVQIAVQKTMTMVSDPRLMGYYQSIVATQE